LYPQGFLKIIGGNMFKQMWEEIANHPDYINADDESKQRIKIGFFINDVASNPLYQKLSDQEKAVFKSHIFNRPKDNQTYGVKDPNSFAESPLFRGIEPGIYTLGDALSIGVDRGMQGLGQLFSAFGAKDIGRNIEDMGKGWEVSDTAKGRDILRRKNA
jgi:hypothetical protein